MNNIVQKAINFASEVHKTQFRKGKRVPYITHPLAVAEILKRVTNDENIIAAGILHDTIEDCEPYGSVTKETIEMEFNSNIARMVDDVTEQDKTLPWMQRKMAALAHVKNMSHDSLLVKSADLLQNLSEINSDLEKNGIEVFKNFHASKEDTIFRFERLIPEIRKAWGENPLLGNLEAELSVLVKYR